MKTVLKKLGIEPVNKGASTGSEWINTSGEETSSYSPTDSSLIAKVTNATIEDYEYLMTKAHEARHRSEVK
jgi:aldehyde dehydrogenase (NAD+)